MYNRCMYDIYIYMADQTSTSASNVCGVFPFLKTGSPTLGFIPCQQLCRCHVLHVLVPLCHIGRSSHSSVSMPYLASQ